jgi:hypothetical protein
MILSVDGMAVHTSGLEDSYGTWSFVFWRFLPSRFYFPSKICRRLLRRPSQIATRAEHYWSSWCVLAKVLIRRAGKVWSGESREETYK